MCSCALCTVDDASYFLVIRLGPKTSECEKNVIVMSTVTSCEVSNCAATFHRFNKQLCIFTVAVGTLHTIEQPCVLPPCSLTMNLYIWLLYPPRCRNVGSPVRSLDRQRGSTTRGGAAPCHNNTYLHKTHRYQGNTPRNKHENAPLNERESEMRKIIITIIKQLMLDKNPCITSELLKSPPKVDLAKSS